MNTTRGIRLGFGLKTNRGGTPPVSPLNERDSEGKQVHSLPLWLSGWRNPTVLLIHLIHVISDCSGHRPWTFVRITTEDKSSSKLELGLRIPRFFCVNEKTEVWIKVTVKNLVHRILIKPQRVWGKWTPTQNVRSLTLRPVTSSNERHGHRSLYRSKSELALSISTREEWCFTFRDSH